jgi:hypothetical protein
MKITFVPGTKDIENNVPCPEPSKFFIPEWYKNIPGAKDLVNVKKCIPFLDSLTQGYIQKTWADIHIIKEKNEIKFHYDGNIPIFNFRERSDMPVQNEFYNIEFVWQRPWSVILPEGYSGLVVHPLNRIDLPFITLSGVVDFDKSIHAPIGNIPFYIKNGFSGIIPSGTPMFQIIPIKRNEWVSEKKQYAKDFWAQKNNERLGISDFYKKKIWKRKSFD